jgi:hypothetical protein
MKSTQPTYCITFEEDYGFQVYVLSCLEEEEEYWENITSDKGEGNISGTIDSLLDHLWDEGYRIYYQAKICTGEVKIGGALYEDATPLFEIEGHKIIGNCTDQNVLDRIELTYFERTLQNEIEEMVCLRLEQKDSIKINPMLWGTPTKNNQLYIN